MYNRLGYIHIFDVVKIMPNNITAVSEPVKFKSIFSFLSSLFYFILFCVSLIIIKTSSK